MIFCNFFASDQSDQKLWIRELTRPIIMQKFIKKESY